LARYFSQTIQISPNKPLAIANAWVDKWLVWLGGSVVERRSLTGELSLACTGPAADG